jgi:5-methylcytosine-specific restriction endonuclease McrA
MMIMANNFYKSPAWKRKRANILRRDGYMCRECKRYGKTTEATTVHHINPLENYPELKLVNENLLSLCGACHDKMHDRISNKLTTLGIEWVKRASPHLQKINN